VADKGLDIHILKGTLDYESKKGWAQRSGDGRWFMSVVLWRYRSVWHAELVLSFGRHKDTVGNLGMGKSSW